MSKEQAALRVHVVRQSPDAAAAGERVLAVEAPVAVEVNGLGYAVMMATPADLEDFGAGFALTERLAGRPSDIVDVEAHALEKGWLLRVTVREDGFAAVRERVRHRVADSGCGLCGLENLEQAIRPLPAVAAVPRARPAALFAALAALRDHQPLGAATGAAHGAALCADDGRILEAREDVGRHNAFDKLIGACLRQDRPLDEGFVLLTSRCSYELVEKAAVAGVPMLVTISAPTSLAVERARECGLTLVSLARSDSVLVMNDPHQLFAS